MDFHHFFPSAPHALIYQRHRDLILNEQIRAIADTVVASVPGGVGMPLGVEPSQQEMVALPSSLDNWLKCQKSIHGAGHYMDDYATVLDSPAQAEEIMEETIRRAEAMGLQVNRNKCHIVPLDKPFRFCKCKFYLTETGRVITHGDQGRNESGPAENPPLQAESGRRGNDRPAGGGPAAGAYRLL